MKSQSCREEEDYQHEYKTCNKGYYLSELTNRSECLTCNKIKDCIECEEDNFNLNFIKYKNGYQLLNNLCIEKECEIGENEKCASCKTEIGRKNECNTCNEGYFISEDNSTFCSKCSIENCKKCSILNNVEICDECLDTFIGKEKNGYIKTCECESGFYNKNGLCVKDGNWIRLLMNVDITYENG